jgi:hypothetical protein
MLKNGSRSAIAAQVIVQIPMDELEIVAKFFALWHW